MQEESGFKYGFCSEKHQQSRMNGFFICSMRILQLKGRILWLAYPTPHYACHKPNLAQVHPVQAHYQAKLDPTSLKAQFRMNLRTIRSPKAHQLPQELRQKVGTNPEIQENRIRVRVLRPALSLYIYIGFPGVFFFRNRSFQWVVSELKNGNTLISFLRVFLLSFRFLSSSTECLKEGFFFGVFVSLQKHGLRFWLFDSVNLGC